MIDHVSQNEKRLPLKMSRESATSGPSQNRGQFRQPDISELFRLAVVTVSTAENLQGKRQYASFGM
jgi:hypothetical protein